MTPVIYGYSQEVALDMGLTHDDLLVLHLFNKKRKLLPKQLFEDGIYYCVDYKSLFAEVPLFKITYSAFRKYRIGNLVKSGVIQREKMQAKGTIIGLRIGCNYSKLSPQGVYAKELLQKTGDKNIP